MVHSHSRFKCPACLSACSMLPFFLSLLLFSYHEPLGHKNTFLESRLNNTRNASATRVRPRYGRPAIAEY